MRRTDYRPDIDGLRAIAVLSVIFFHFELGPFTGGFVGVDVFFVISGFLITRLIVSDLEAGHFSFRNFYIRRARRILPALFFTLLTTFVAGTLLLDPAKLERLGLSTVSAALSVSNFYFWYNVGYFDISADLKPLLHTWSLSVEEQFYMVWPALLFILFRPQNSRWLLMATLTAIGLCSLAASEWQVRDRPEQVFYLAPYRAFEFVIGAACVWLVRARAAPNSVLELIAVTGLAMIAFAIVSYDKATPFPGLFALVPCLGTAALIYAGQARYSGALLRNRVSVGIGLISYSLYLAHWPLYVFYKNWKFGTLTTLDKFALVAASIACAALMYRFVEQPFRRSVDGAFIVPSPRFLAACAATAFIIVAPAAAAGVDDGWIWRYRPEIRDALLHPTSRRTNDLVNESSRQPFPRPGKKNALIIGDSHATDLFNALALNNPKVHLRRAGVSVLCQPVIKDWANSGHPDAERCKGDFPRILTRRKFGLKEVDFVLISARWRSWALEHFRETISALREATAAKIIVFGPTIEFSPAVPSLLARHGQLAGSRTFVNSFQDVERKRLNETLKSASAQMGVTYIDKIDLVCGKGDCPIFVPNTNELMFVDYGHWSNRGAEYFGQMLRRKRPDVASMLLNATE